MPLGIGAGLAIGSAAGGLINSLVGTAASQNLNGKNRRWQERQNTIAYERQKELTMLSPALQKQGLQMAGISPAAMNGYSGGTASVNASNSAPSSVSPYVPLDINSIMNGLVAATQIDQAKANTNKTNEEAEALRIENAKKRDEMHAWEHATTISYYEDENGNKHYVTDKDFPQWAKDYVNTHGNLPDLVKIQGFKSENAAKVMSSLSNFQTVIAQNGMYQAQSKLAQKVAELKLADSSVMRAIYKMDVAQYNQLMTSIDKLNSDIDVNGSIKALNEAKTETEKQSVLESIARTALLKTQDKSLKNNSVNNLIDELGGTKSTQDNLITVGKIVLSLISGFAHLGISANL